MLKALRVILIAGMIMAPCLAQAQQKLDKVTVPMSDGLHVFAMYVAKGGGFFAKDGIDADFVNLAAGPRQIAALEGGSADLLAISLLQIIKSRAEGANIVALGSMFDVYAVKVVLSNDAIAKTGITADMNIDEKVKRLRGLKIGISSPGSSTDALVRSLFLARGLDPDKNVNLVPLGNGTALLAAFEKKVIDGLAWPAPVPEIIESRGLGKTIIDPFNGEVPELNGVPYLVLATGQNTLAARPDVMRRAMHAVTAAMEFSASHPVESCGMVRPFFKDVEEKVFNMACETYRKGVSHKLELTKAQLDKAVAWMNLGAAEPIKANHDELVSTFK